MLIAGRRYACPAYRSAQGECRPGKAQPPPGVETGRVMDAHCRAALRLPGLGGYGAGCRPGKAGYVAGGDRILAGVTDAAERFLLHPGEG
ncbi:hypothetical protein BME69_24530 [Klebsiella quasipneumoniae subsp. quasipneumoniae]|nr:hypothetical protein BME69_24530 [Klebsiella quasipneumoniae subsp. quasipneumoniae]